MPTTEAHDPTAFGLTRAEYEHICTFLDREPNSVELGMFGVLWSEHCSYKHSKPLLRRLPTAGAQVLQGPGENAGAVDIGHGLAAVMKMESHNHPSAIEPFQGAATGVGGILRDIFTMGARPIALWDALCFGDPGQPRTSYLLNGVVSGIAYYGNCVGVPTVGGCVVFDPSYAGNPLVNVLCLGLVPRDRLITARASGVGNAVLLVGSATGRDGIAGASFASAELGADSEERRPAVQVGNPFLEKLLIEACLELIGDPDVVAMQDLGAAGITGAVTEVAAHGGSGIEIDVAQVSRREEGMTPYEVMLSESQERMLVVVRRGAEERVRAIFARWELHSDLIGRVTEDGLVRVRDRDTIVAQLPATFLSSGAPEYRPSSDLLPPAAPRAEPAPPFPVPADPGAVLLELLDSPRFGSRRSIYEQYDHMVQTNTVVPPGEGAAVLRVKDTPLGLTVGLGVNGRLCSADPFIGGAWIVAEACRNVACAGGRPLALTDCLNFGDPERPAVWEAMAGVVEGIRAACLALEVPVISGNVSLYNETDGMAILPTPIVGVLGVLDDVHRHARAAFTAGQQVWLIGPPTAWLASSEYADARHGWRPGVAPALDLDLERRVQGCARELIRDGWVTAARAVADGGLALALAEMALASMVGVEASGEWTASLESGALGRVDAALFGEAASRIIVGSWLDGADAVVAAAQRWGVPLTWLGTAGGPDLAIGQVVRVPLERLRARWDRAIDRLTGA